MALILVLFFFSYLIGSIPTGFWICKYLFKIDITQHGSGNIGATNVARVLQGGVKYFVLVFLIDALKAYFMLAITLYLLVQKMAFELTQAQNFLLIIACALLLGNAHSVFLKFKGGKGVATTLGIVAYLIPFNLLFLFVISWVALLLTTKMAFVASIGAMVLLTMAYGILYFTPNNLLFYFLVVICYWLVLRHKTNIKNFLRHH